jgi:hypothetical protein
LIGELQAVRSLDVRPVAELLSRREELHRASRNRRPRNGSSRRKHGDEDPLVLEDFYRERDRDFGNGSGLDRGDTDADRGVSEGETERRGPLGRGARRFDELVVEVQGNLNLARVLLRRRRERNQAKKTDRECAFHGRYLVSLVGQSAYQDAECERLRAEA